MIVLLVLLFTIPLIFKKQIESFVIEKIDAQISAKVFFKDISVSAFKHFPHITVTLNDVSVTGIGDFSGDTLVSAKEIDGTFSIATFLRGQHEVNGIHLQDPLISVRILQNGKANYDIVKPGNPIDKQSQQKSFEIAIDQWSINNGRIIYDDKLQKTYIEVGGLYHSGSGDFKQEISDLDLTTKVTDLTFQYNGIRYFTRKLFAADLNMEMNLKEKKFTFKDHAFQLGDFKFGFEGYFKLLDKGYETDLKFKVNETSFKNLLSLMPGIYKKDMEGIETRGDFTCEGKIKGVYNVKSAQVPTFHIDLKVIDAMFKYSHLPKALEKINFNFIADNPDGNPESTTYDLKTFHCEMDKLPIHGSASIHGNRQMQVIGDLKIKANLTELENFIPLEGVILKGYLDADLVVNGIYNDSLGKLPAFHADVKVENAMFKYKKLPKSIDKINLHLVANNVDGLMEHLAFSVPVFHFEVDKNPVHGNFSVKGFKDMQVDADIKLMADLAQLEKIYPVDGIVLKGILNSEIKIAGRYNDSLKLFPKADVFVALEKGYVKSKNMPVEMDSIHLNAEIANTTGRIEDTRISLVNLTFLLDDEPFVMSGTVSDLKDYNYALKIDGLLDLEKLTQLYPINNTTARGTLDFDIVTKGNVTQIEAKNYNFLKAKGTLEMKNVSYKNTEIAFPIHIDDALFTFNSDKIELTRFKAEFGKSNVSLTGHLYNYIPFLIKNDAPIKGDLAMVCDTMDLNEWFPASVNTGSGSVANTDATGKTVTTSTLSGSAASKQPEVLVIPENVAFVFDSDIKMVKFGTMDIANLDGEIRIQNGILTLKETGFNTLDSKISISGDYNTKNSKHPTFDIDLDIAKMDFNKAYKTFVDPKGTCPAAGNFSTKYSLSGELNPDFSPIYSSVAGAGKIVIDSVSMKGMKLMNHIKSSSGKDEFKDPNLNDVTINTEIKKGKFLIYPFTFKVSKFLTEVEGEQGIEDETINYLIKISVPPFNKLKIPMTIKGTADKPVIKMGKGFDNSDFEKL